MAKKINVSFKETQRELSLYEQITTQIDKSAFLKEAALFYLEHINGKKISSKGLVDGLSVKE